MKKTYFFIGLFIGLGILMYIDRQKLLVITTKTEQKAGFFSNCELVTITSTHDSQFQKAYFQKSSLPGKQPLVVSLHTWGGTYKQADSILLITEQKKWHYIHPDYRGQQWLDSSCCYEPAIQDIDDAIAYAIKNANVDTSKIILIGKSGGGTGVLASFLRSRYRNLHFMCWSPITDYISWYHEAKNSPALTEKYLKKILLGTRSKNDILDTVNAKLKSPYYFEFSKYAIHQFKTLQINAGIRDGLDDWSTSISQPIRFYNKLLREMNCRDSASYITHKEHQALLAERQHYPHAGNEKLGGRNIIIQKKYHNIKFVLFDGGHEILLDAVVREFNTIN